MDVWLGGTLALIVILLFVFGGVCQKNCYSQDDTQRNKCRTWGGALLLTLVVLMIAAIVMCFRSGTGGANMGEEYYPDYQNIADIADVSSHMSSHMSSHVTTLDNPADMWRNA
jgi:hypothetical protein